MFFYALKKAVFSSKEQDDLANEIDEELENGDSVEDPHPFFVEGLDEGLCDLAKDMKEAPSFEDSKFYGIGKARILKALGSLDIPVKKRMTKEELGKLLVDFIQDHCGCLIFVEREN